VPLTNTSVRGFRTWGIRELKEGRPVQYGTLISAAARRMISLRFRLNAEQAGFCDEFPNGARSVAEIAELDALCATGDQWWMDWPDLKFFNCLVRAFPKETEGTAAMSQSLKERFSKIKLSVSVSDFTPLTRYLGEVHQACELSQPKVPGDEVQCVKRLHAGFSGTDTSTATSPFKIQLDVAFANRLPATINRYLLEVDRQYGMAARADALSRMYSGQRISKSHNNRDSDEPGGRGGGGGGGSKGGGGGRGGGAGGGKGGGGGGGAPQGVKRERGKCTGCGADHDVSACDKKDHVYFNAGGTAWRDSVQAKHEFRARKAVAETENKPPAYIEKMTKADFIPGAAKVKKQWRKSG
jgi:hypothetical protein